MEELLEKNVIVARSGIHKYLRRELKALKVGTVPPQHKDLTEFSVYRSAALIADSKDYYTRKPFIHTHKAYVNPENFTDLVEGWTGDEATVELNEDKTEAVIRTSLTIGGIEAMNAFKLLGEKEVSPLHFGKYVWNDGVSPDGTPFQIEHVAITGVNHVALVPAGRGGSDAAILDHLEQDEGFLTGIWRYIKKFLSGVADELPETFRVRLDEIAKGRAIHTPETLETSAKALWDCLKDLPYTDDLALLHRYLGDIKGLIRGNDEGENKITDAEAEKYVALVSDLYEKLDNQSIEEVTKEEKDMGKSKDELAKEEEDKKAAVAKDADTEWDQLSEAMKKHREGGGKASDWKMGKSKDADEESEEDKKKREEEEAKKKEAASKDAEAEETKKKEEEAKKKADEDKAKAEDAAVADAAAKADAARYGSPWSMAIADSAPSGDDPAAKLLGKMGYGPGKEKK